MELFQEKTVLSVSRLTALLRGVIEENFDAVWVEGEVSNISFPSSGHVYFSLKDAGAQIRCVMFKGTARNLKFRPADGMGLVLRGHLSVYDARGEYQIICEYLEPKGIGALQMAFMQLKEKLAAEGLFDENRKKTVPAFPKRVGIITSPTGAAIHDIMNVLRRRFSSLEILVYPVRVQGEGAAAEIAGAIAEMNRLALADVLIVGRGGGSLEDLWAFNEETVARAVSRSKIPVISAVGHETDWTICDFVSDLRAPTPSAAAELVIASSEELRGRIDSLAHRLRTSMENRISLLSGKVDGLTRALHDPGTIIGHAMQRVDDMLQRLEMGMERILENRRELLHRLHYALNACHPSRRTDSARQQLALLNMRLSQLMGHRLDSARRSFSTCSARLDTLSPLNTLSRGYSIVQFIPDGEIVSDSEKIRAGDRLRLSFRNGRADCVVEETC